PMLPAHPPPAPLPYTTLFRSDREADEYAGHSGLLEEGALARKSELHRYRFFAGPVAPNWLIVTQFCADGDRAAAYFASADELMRDRKSTRLNSSHVKSRMPSS